MKGIAMLAWSVTAVMACSPNRTDVQHSSPASTISDDSAASSLAPQLYTVVTPATRGDSTAAALAELREKSVDSLVTSNRSAIIFAASLPGRRLETISTPDDAPDSADEIFAVLRDGQGRVEYAAESPVSQSGDWNMESTHYFDTAGATMVVEREASFFNGCTLAKSDSTVGIRETVTSDFAPRNRLVKRTFVRTMFDDSTLAPLENCNESFRTGYPIYPTWDSLAAATGLGALLQQMHH